MEIRRSKKMETMVLERVKGWLQRKPRSQDKLHVSDLLYPRKTYWQRIMPQPISDLQAGYFIAGHAHHQVVEAALGPKYKWRFGDLMFLAGLVEGEGHFGVNGTGAVPYLQIDNTKESLVQWPVGIFGGRVSKRKELTRGGRIHYTWTICSTAAEAVVKAIHPFLVSKRLEADIWLELKEKAPGKGHPLSQKEKTERQGLVDRLKAARKEDSKAQQLHGRSDAGEFEKDGIYYSPDLRVPYPIEFKTSRAMYEPKDLEKGYEGYLKQLTAYQALMDSVKGGLLVFYLTLKNGFKRQPAFRYYTVRLSEADLKKRRKELKLGAKALTEAIDKKNHKALPLCPAWLCRDCVFLKQCKPWKTDKKRAGLQNEEEEG